MAVEPGADIAQRVMLEPASGPRPRQRRRAEETPDRPQPDVADEDAERARQDPLGHADLAALDEKPGRDAREIFRSKRAKRNREDGQHVMLTQPPPLSRVGQADIHMQRRSRSTSHRWWCG